jgi:hemerythrin-like domain-containing protein
MPDVFSVLGEDHVEVKQMLLALENSPDNSRGAGQAVLAARYEVVQRLVIDSSRHEAAEEQLFWPAVRDKLTDGDGLADEAIAQESEAKQVLDRLEKLEPADEEFDQLVATLIPATRQHIEFEETQVWPSMRQALSQEEAQELGGKVQKAKELGPTRPHPHTPANPALLKTLGPAVAVVDKLRDAAAGRGN